MPHATWPGAVTSESISARRSLLPDELSDDTDPRQVQPLGGDPLFPDGSSPGDPVVGEHAVALAMQDLLTTVSTVRQRLRDKTRRPREAHATREESIDSTADDSRLESDASRADLRDQGNRPVP